VSAKTVKRVNEPRSFGSKLRQANHYRDDGGDEDAEGADPSE
jgi:hypothetical protein